ncbi:Chitin synthase, class 3 [Apophysomyces ossiformis]|uniref:chitin synthase n=1 Tax=Apophysomyces ossiformis TaxID=679940 RepID=A0A8H7BTA1_9FUNG|nr:Chitin synthase, class 3 [Apophysomyces ossiformis]
MQASENIKKNDRDGAKPLPPKPNAKKPSGSALRVDTSIKQDRNHKDPDAIAPVAEPNQRASEEYEPAPITGFSKQRSRPDELCRSRYLTMFSTTTEKPSHHIKSMQQAWREKVTLVQFILLLCIAVGFLTFGFNATVCGRQPMRIQPAGIQNDQIVISGRAFDLKTFRHPTPVPNMPGSGDLQELGVGGMDLSFLFQTVNYNCKGILHPVIQDDAHGNVANYFPCVPLDRFHPEINSTSNPQRIGCHISPKARNALKDLTVVGDVYYNWTDIQQPGTSLVAFNGNVLDISRLRFLTPNIPMPLQIAQIVGPGSAFIGRDATYWLSTTADRLRIGKCMTDILKVGVLDTRSTGCIISDIVLWVSLAVILGVVLIRFLLALIFGWCISWKLGSIREETAEERRKRQEAVLHWEMNNVEQMHYPKSRSIETVDHRDERSSTSGGIGATGPHALQNTSSSSFSGRGAGSATSSSIAPKKRRFLPTTSRFTQPPQSPSYTRPRGYNSPLTASQDFPHSPSTMPSSPANNNNNNNSNNNGSSGGIPYTFSSQFFYNTPLQNSRAAAMALQARKQYNFNFDLIHTFMVVTCYSEGEEGLRTTLDSLANTDYPATHKLLLVICDGIITGSGNTMSTPDTVLSMMKDDIVPRDEVKACSYVAIADGVKRHNMAKVYAGYYRYNDDPSKAPEVRPEEQQQYVPMIVIVKCGTEAEARDKKPGNRGKRDSQVILMNAMQKVYYGERMCALEYQFCKAIVKLTGFHPSCYETCLMVDADTKVYPDSLARMVACMSRDPYIMGLCGETKIANKSDSWVTAIQVFEYYISHHMSKAFESIFGGVTCLPGCFCMYRIIAPKGDRFVPIFCSTDIVEMYCENIVDTLHKKNLLLLGEDRYLTTLMLRTFPKRKMIFVPQAVCKTVVPDTFSVLLSQRRRWINSTVHNLLELVLIRDLCGTFCFSMQFVVFMELVGTVVLPAAISFTFYLIIISCYVRPIPIIPLMLLAAILGLPAVLIALTTCKMVYVVWMLVYLFSLPIWNFVLPAYAYWHFDDFSWGQTRQVKGSEGKREDHGRREGQFDSTGIVMRRFEEWHKHERTLMAEGKSGQQTLVRNYPTIYYGH